MAPYLTERGKAALAVSLLWLATAGILLVAGRTASAWPVLVVASLQLAGLLLAFFATVPLAKCLESSALELSFELASESVALHTDDHVEIDAVLCNRTAHRLRRLQVGLEHSSPLQVMSGDENRAAVPGASVARLRFVVRAHKSGRWFLHGMHLRALGWGHLFEARTYRACPEAYQFLPRGLVVGRRRELRPRLARLYERVGVHHVRQRGFGTHLREIREHQYGDPFRHIAWKASARTGRLMVREFESEIALNVYLVVDVSATMRGSIEHGGKLEHMVRMGFNFAHTVMSGNDRCGLITFDESVYGHIAPKDGAAHLQRLSNHLVGTSSVVKEGFTEYDDDEVLQAVVDYLALEKRLDFRRRDVRRPKRGKPVPFEKIYDVELLNRWLHGDLRFADPAMQQRLSTGIVGYDAMTLARQYAHLHGIELPYRAELRYGTKEQGLVEALELIMRESRNPHIILVLSDLTGLVDTDRVARALKVAMARRHQVALFAPFTPRYVPRNTPENADENHILHELFSAAEGRERRAVMRALQGTGARFVEVGPGDSVNSLLSRVGLWG